MTPEQQRAAGVVLARWWRALFPPLPRPTPIGFPVEAAAGVPASPPRCVPGPALMSTAPAGDRSEGSPAAHITESRHSVGFPEHLRTVDELEHALNDLAEVRGRVAEVEALLTCWLVAMNVPGNVLRLQATGARWLIPRTMRAFGQSPVLEGGRWTDGTDR